MAIRPDEALRAKALAVSAVSTALGTRFYPNAAPQKVAYPYAVTGVEESEHLGHLAGKSGWVRARIALEIIGGTSYEAAKDIAEALRIALHNAKGTVTIGSDTEKITTFLDKQEDIPEWSEDGSAKPIFGVRQTWTLMMTEAVS